MEPHQLAPAWIALGRAVGAQDDVAGTGARLLKAYGDPGRRYHDLHHLMDVLGHVDELADVATDADAVRLAAWFHDAIYDPTRTDNEVRSALLAEHELARLRVADAVIGEAVRLVRLTETHDPEPDDRNGAVLCDADLAVLARDPAGYTAYASAVRQEYAHVPDHAFRAGRTAVLRRLLLAPELFRTSYGRSHWEARARANLASELTLLARG